MSEPVAVRGVLERTYYNETAKGTTYGVVVNGTRYSTWKTQCTVKENTPVKFMARQNGNFWNVVNNVVEPDPDGAVSAPAPAQATGPAPSAYGVRTSGPDARSQRIEAQSARKDAINLITAAIAADAVSLPAKAEAKWDALMAMVTETTRAMVDVVDSTVNRSEEESSDSPV